MLLLLMVRRLRIMGWLRVHRLRAIAAIAGRQILRSGGVGSITVGIGSWKPCWQIICMRRKRLAVRLAGIILAGQYLLRGRMLLGRIACHGVWRGRWDRPHWNSWHVRTCNTSHWVRTNFKVEYEERRQGHSKNAYLQFAWQKGWHSDYVPAAGTPRGCGILSNKASKAAGEKASRGASAGGFALAGGFVFAGGTCFVSKSNNASSASGLKGSGLALLCSTAFFVSNSASRAAGENGSFGCWTTRTSSNEDSCCSFFGGSWTLCGLGADDLLPAAEGGGASTGIAVDGLAAAGGGMGAMAIRGGLPRSFIATAGGAAVILAVCAGPPAGADVIGCCLGCEEYGTVEEGACDSPNAAKSRRGE